MTATNKTTNYQLPIYLDTDAYNVMGDFNGAMDKIDTQLKTNADATAAQSTTIAAIDLRCTKNSTDIDGVRTTANAATATADAAKATAQAAADGVGVLNSQMTNATSDIASNTANISALGDTVGLLQSSVAGKADTNHASPVATYGVGNATNYGHVKLADSAGQSGASGGTAATPLCVQSTLSDFRTLNSIGTLEVNTVTGNFSDSRISLDSDGYVKIVKHNGIGVVNIYNLRCNNTTAQIAWVPILNLSDYGITFTGTDYDMRNVVMTTDGANTRMLRIVRSSDGKPQLMISCPNNTNWVFAGQLTFAFTATVS